MRFTLFYELVFIMPQIKQVFVALLLRIYVVAQIPLQIDISRALIIYYFDIVVNIFILLLLKIKLICEWIILILANVYRHVVIRQFLISIILSTCLVFTCDRAKLLSLYFNVVLMIKIHFVYLGGSLLPILFRFLR